MKKRAVSILLCVITLFAAAPMAFSADSIAYTGDCALNDSGTLVITGDAEVSGGDGEISIIIEETADRVFFTDVVADVVTINGGKIIANGANGISANSIEINGGALYAKGSTSYGIRTETEFIVNGGKTTAKGPVAGVYSAGEINCLLPVEQGMTSRGDTMEDVNAQNGMFYVEGSPATVVWLADTAPCEHTSTVTIDREAATCAEPGYTGDTICDDCMVTVKKGSRIEALGHIYYDGKCLRCGKTDPATSFTDVKGVVRGYRTAIAWAVENDVTGGYKQSDGTIKFYPNHLCTRAQVITFIWRANGSPEPEKQNNPFSDIDSKSPFYTAILWAAENDIVTGYEDGTFRPNGGCTRADVIGFIWRSEDKPQCITKTMLSDIQSLNYEYAKAISWAAEKGITTRYSDGTFCPLNVCTRAQAVSFIYRDKNGK